MSDNIKFLDQVDLIELRVSTWSGEKALSRREKDLLNVQTTPDDRHFKGAEKTLVFGQHLRRFQTRRARIEQLLCSYGTRFGSLYAIRSAEMPEVISGLESHKASFQAEVDDFIANLKTYYKEVVDDLLAKGKKEWAQAVESAQMSPYEVRDHFKMRYMVFKYGASQYAPDDSDSHTVDLIFDSVCRDLFTLLKNHITKVNGHPERGFFRSDVRGTFSHAAKKARSFDFLPDGNGLSIFAQKCERIANGNGTIQGAEYEALAALFDKIETGDDMTARILDLATSNSVYDARFDDRMRDLFAAPPPAAKPKRQTANVDADDVADASASDDTGSSPASVQQAPVVLPQAAPAVPAATPVSPAPAATSAHATAALDVSDTDNVSVQPVDQDDDADSVCLPMQVAQPDIDSLATDVMTNVAAEPVVDPFADMDDVPADTVPAPTAPQSPVAPEPVVATSGREPATMAGPAPAVTPQVTVRIASQPGSGRRRERGTRQVVPV